MTEAEKQMFFDLLVDLLIDNPKRKAAKDQKEQQTDESIPQRTTDRPAKSNHRQTTAN